MAGEETQDPLIGARIGPCRVETRLAAGGMGVVYRARHLQLGQDVAVKILSPSLAQDQEYVTRFFREAGAAGQIDHPNVVRVIDVGKYEDRYYLVMEFVSGDTLDRILELERKVPLERATRLTREIAAGLAAAHRAGIIHRDVKPGNIIVSPDDRPHLTDFGLARHAETRKGLTIEGTFLGTPEYSSPEQVEGRKLDHRTDLYSLGVTYFQLLSGTLPFLGESPMEIAIKRTKEPARPLENALPSADPRACALVAKLLKPEPSQRYQSATDVIRDLDAILSGEKPAAVRATESTKVRSAADQVRSRRRVRAFLHWDLLATAALLAFVSGGLAARGGSFLEHWTASDSAFGLRAGLLAASVVVAGVGVFLFTRDLASKGRLAAASGLVLLALLVALATGTGIERSEESSSAAVVAATLRAALGRAGEPVCRLAWSVFLLLAAALVSFEHQPGAFRVNLSRIMAAGAFLLAYGFGVGVGPVAGPFREIMTQAELSIPLLTATLLGCFFGALLLTGYGFEPLARSFGLALSVAAAGGLFAFACLVGPDARGVPWTELLARPFADLGRAFRGAGAGFAVVASLALVEGMVVSAGFRRQERVTTRRR